MGAKKKAVVVLLILSLGLFGACKGPSGSKAQWETGKLQPETDKLQAATGKPQMETGSKDIREANYARQRRFKALLYWDPHAESAHVDFARQSMEFYRKLNYGEGFFLETTTNLTDYTLDQLKEFSVIVALNAQPRDSLSRTMFEEYMESGGGWVGYHAAGYNDRRTNWPWYSQFLGCGTFKCNNWPPQPALLDIEVQDNPVTKNLPASFVIPASEFYQWADDLRANKDIEVLASLSPKNYPLGIKDIIYGGDFPIVWTNTRYRMVYLNMGHGDEEYEDPAQKLLFLNAFRWIVSRDSSGDPFDR